MARPFSAGIVTNYRIHAGQLALQPQQHHTKRLFAHVKLQSRLQSTMATPSPNSLALQLRSLHVPGRPLLLTNVYDGATARVALSNPSTTALATASFAIAETQGTTDAALTFPENLAGIRAVARVLRHERPDIPLSADLQDGYEDIAATVRAAVAEGVVGANIEDADMSTGKLRTVEDAVARIRAVLAAAKMCGVDGFCINARTDVLVSGGSVEDAITRGKAYLNAGAVTVFVWGGRERGVSRAEVKRLVEGLDGRVAVKMNLKPGALTVRELAEIGVARVSVGPELYRRAMAGFRDAVDKVIESHQFE
jgi:2-methylisocitrate lyase-like PEP mutase family enzyme